MGAPLVVERPSTVRAGSQGSAFRSRVAPMAPDLPRLRNAIVDRLMRHAGDVERVTDRHKPRLRHVIHSVAHVARRLIVPKLTQDTVTKLVIEFGEIAKVEQDAVGPDARRTLAELFHAPTYGSEVRAFAVVHPVDAGLGILRVAPEFLCAGADFAAEHE